jgi:hypothetical protein
VSPSVGRHNTPPRSSLASPSSAPLLLSPSVGRHNAPQRSTLRGQLLVEVFAAYSDFPFRGTITIFDGSTSNYLYRRWVLDSDADFYSQKKEWLTTHADDSEFKVYIYTYMIAHLLSLSRLLARLRFN